MHDLWLARFNEEILPIIIEKFKPSKVLFFGSRVSGAADEDSDIDIIIISKEFKCIPFVNRMAKILNLAQFPKHVDYLCYTPEEFDNVKDSSVVIENALENYIEAIL